MKITWPEFNGDIVDFTSNIIIEVDGSSQRSNEAFIVKM